MFWPNVFTKKSRSVVGHVGITTTLNEQSAKTSDHD